MISKPARQSRIIETVRNDRVTSQDELASILAKHGIHAAQSTLSRDMRDLGLIKVRGRYRMPADLDERPQRTDLRRSLRQLVVKHAVSGNILMVRTDPGNAHSLGVVLDSARWPEIMGTVAGDDTVFALLRSPKDARRVQRRLEELTV